MDDHSRSLLHRACQKGVVPLVKDLISKFITHKISLNSPDVNNATPLMLACIQGFDSLDQIMNKDIEVKKGYYASHRYHVVKMLLNAVDLKGKRAVSIDYSKLRRKINCPLHWAIYWGDYYLSKLLIYENPKLVFFENEKK